MVEELASKKIENKDYSKNATLEFKLLCLVFTQIYPYRSPAV